MFTHRIKPKPEEIDLMGHINNVVYVRYVQEVADAHWEKYGSPEQHKKLLWVVLRHEIDYRKPAFLKDEIIGTTWVDPPEGPKIKRHVELKRAGDNDLLVKASTIWCAIDSGTGKPLRLDNEIMEVFRE